jgi:hypothetical protein
MKPDFKIGAAMNKGAAGNGYCMSRKTASGTAFIVAFFVVQLTVAYVRGTMLPVLVIYLAEWRRGGVLADEKHFIRGIGILMSVSTCILFNYQMFGQ